MNETHGYRADIDGLRALAILSVVAYHAGVPGFGGGFVGVDVFFVISGYLITSIIERERAAGHFSLLGFYERRVRRILPALYAVLVVSALVAPLLLFPPEAEAFARSLVAATLFVSTLLFRSEAGYFDLDAEVKPLLHTWSLSVEEIFYIVFPLLFLATWWRAPRQRFAVLTGLAVASFLGASLAVLNDPHSRAAFFLPHLRAWEFLVGALIALAPAWRLRRRQADLASMLGVGLILVAVVGFSAATPFPGPAALIPVAGAALVIAAGQHHPSLVGRGLAWRPVVLVGLMSYSLYLWHWPILVFARAALERAPTLVEALALVAMSLLIAALSWRYVERPFRGKSGLLSRPRLFVAAGGVGLVLIGVGVHGVTTGGWLGRYPPVVATILAAAEDRDQRRRECLHTRFGAAGCTYGAPDGPVLAALWGDSHAAVYAVQLGELAAAQGGAIRAFTMPGCAPVRDWQSPTQPRRAACAEFQARAWAAITESPGIDTVVVAARFLGYPHDDPTAGFTVALTDTVTGLLAAGKRVVLVYPVPDPGEDVPQALVQAWRNGLDPTDLGQPRARFEDMHRAVEALLDGLGTHSRLVRLHPADALCDGDFCPLMRDGRVLYYSVNHLSLSGAALLGPAFASLLKIPYD